jgi:hypothetical protein
MTFRSIALVGAAFATLVMLKSTDTVMAQGRLGDPDRPAYQGEPPRPDFPGAKQPNNAKVPQQPEAAQSPRSDFPGAKQSDSPSQK